MTCEMSPMSMGRTTWRTAVVSRPGLFYHGGGAGYGPPATTVRRARRSRVSIRPPPDFRLRWWKTNSSSANHPSLRPHGHRAGRGAGQQDEEGVVPVQRSHVGDVRPAGEEALQAASDVAIGGGVAAVGAGERLLWPRAVGAGPARVVPAGAPLQRVGGGGAR